MRGIQRALVITIGAFLFAGSEESLVAVKRLLAGQEFAQALIAVEEVLARNPADLTALKLKADIHYLLNDDGNAERTLLSGLRIDPEHVDLNYALGRIYSQQTRYDAAIQQFEKVLRIQPGSYKAHDNLGLCYEHLNQPERAIRSYSKAIELVHKDAASYDWPYANLANLLLNQGEYKQAFNLAAEAAQKNPQSARNYYLTGKALVRLEQGDKSLRWLKRSIELDPEYPEPHYLLGQVLRKTGRVEEADQEFARFKELRAKAPARLR